MSSGWAMAAAGWGPGAFVLAALVAVIGAMAVHHFSRRRTAGHTGSDAPLGGIEAMMRETARRMGIEERVLPRVARPSPADGDYVYSEGAEYVYCGVERGTRMYEHRAASADELLYLVFKDRAWMKIYFDLMGQDLSPEDHAARLAAGQRELLAKGNPAWAERLAAGA